MERSNSLIKFMSFVMALALVAYLGYAIYEARTNPLRMAPVSSYEAHDNLNTSGYAVYDEELLKGGSRDLYVSVSEGEKLAAGEIAAREYSGQTALRKANRLREISIEIEQLKNLNISNTAKNAKDSVYRLAKAKASGSLSDLDAIVLDIKTFILTGTENITQGEIESRIESLEEEQDRLEGEMSAVTSEIRVDSPVIFSYMVDGYDGIDIEKLKDMTPEDYKNTFAGNKPVRNDVFGKLVKGMTWYYVTLIDASSASRVAASYRENGYLTVRFVKTYINEVRMNLEGIGDEENGKCVAVFSSKKFLQDVVSVRELEGEVIFGVTRGLKIPAEAVRLDENGDTYVYILSGMQAEQVYIKILTEDDEYYVVSSENAALRDGSQIIVRANDLYDGKVVV